MESLYCHRFVPWSRSAAVPEGGDSVNGSLAAATTCYNNKHDYVTRCQRCGAVKDSAITDEIEQPIAYRDTPGHRDECVVCRAEKGAKP